MINVVFNIIWLYKADKHSFIQFLPCYIFDKRKVCIVDNVLRGTSGLCLHIE